KVSEDNRICCREPVGASVSEIANARDNCGSGKSQSYSGDGNDPSSTLDRGRRDVPLNTGCRFLRPTWSSLSRKRLLTNRNPHDRSYEAIAPAADRLQKARLLGMVLEGLANLADRRIDAAVRV